MDELFLRLILSFSGLMLAIAPLMNKSWLLSILIISLILLGILKASELKSLSPFFKADPVIKLKSFTEARSRIPKEDLEHLKLWESILTGRSAPLSRLLKEKYKSLGLNHLFTPSGFHLSAVLFPFLKLIKTKYHLLVLIILGSALFFMPGLTALKRMLTIKTHQEVFGMHAGFCLALMADMLFGSFQNGALSFTYSFLFIGIIYSGLQGLSLIIWFFIAQIILAYFQNADISPLILLASPILNLCFGFVMPLLFLLAFPLWDWQLFTGIQIIKGLQYLVTFFSNLSIRLPMIEIHSVILICVGFLVFRNYRWALIAFVLLSSSLNLDRESIPSMPSKEFSPQGNIVETFYREKDVVVYFKDGKCRMKLVQGFWFENCSPVRRSSRKKKIS
jgi:MFS family permease